MILNRKEYPEKAEQFEQFRAMYGLKGVYGRTLTLKNTGDTMVCSHADWLKANACKWFLNYEGRVHNQAGIFFEDYVGIVMPRKENPTHHLDLSRYNYKYY